MDTIKIQKFENGQETEIHKLIKRVYDEFVATDYSDQGNNTFYDWIEPSKIVGRQKSQINLWVAFVDSRLVGMIEIRDNMHISLLFIDKKHHGRGIAKGLFHESLKICIQRDPSLDKFYVHASPFSIPIYKKLGFVETNSMQENHGIKYMPMEMTINK